MTYREYRELQFDWRLKFKGKRSMMGLAPREITTKRLWVRIREAIHDEWDMGETVPMRILGKVKRRIAGLNGDSLARKRIIEIGCVMLCKTNLTLEQRDEIVKSYDAGEKAEVIAEKFDVSIRYVCVLAWGAKAHRGRARKVDALMAHRIRRRWRNGESSAALARQYKLSVMTVNQVLENKTHIDPNWTRERPRIKYRDAVEVSRLLAQGKLPCEVLIIMRKKEVRHRFMRLTDVAAVAYGDLWPELWKWHRDAVRKWEEE
jgi:hypothetical protein